MRSCLQFGIWPLLLASVLGAVSCTCPAQTNATSPYAFSAGRELGIILPGLAFEGVGQLARTDAEALWQKARSTDRNDLPRFDRAAAFRWDLRAHRTSNVLLITGIGGALAMAIAYRPTPGAWPPLVLTAESDLLAIGLMDMVKTLAHRPRPYVYNPDVPEAVRRSPEAYTSFWSGHTANTAASTFACAQIVQQGNASATAKTITWSVAAAWPMAVGYYRVRSGRHFPTDVIVGYLVGAGIGMAVPYIHQLGVKNPAP